MSHNMYVIIKNELQGTIELHLGQWSIGWKFLFQSLPNVMWEGKEINLSSKSAWKEFILKNKAIIKDSYGRVQSSEEFFADIEENYKDEQMLSRLIYRGRENSGDKKMWDSAMKNHFKDSEGYEFGIGEFS